MIKYIQRRHIDDERWDKLISSSEYETVYPYSWYLDSCADNWGAFVMNDYECVMPVAYRSKMGLKYIYQPRFCQQLGVYSENKIDNEIVRMFLHALGQRFKVGDYSFNEGNLLGDEPGFELSDNANYTLNMHNSYEKITAGYTQNCKRNISKSYSSGLNISEDISVEEIVYLKKGIDLVKGDVKHYTFLINMFSSLQKQGRIKIVGAKIGSHICAAAIFAFADKRVHYLLSFSSETGKEKRAMFMVLDSFIKAHSSKGLTLDFEGSNISTIARFFAGFGARPEIYQRVSFENSTSKIINKLRSV